MVTTKELLELVENQQKALKIQAEQIELITKVLEKIDIRLKFGGL